MDNSEIERELEVAEDTIIELRKEIELLKEELKNVNPLAAYYKEQQKISNDLYGRYYVTTEAVDRAGTVQVQEVTGVEAPNEFLFNPWRGW